MSVNHDVSTRFPTSTTASDVTTGARTWTHTSGGTAKGGAVAIVLQGPSTDVVSAVSWGGVAMDRVQFAVDTAGEPGSAYVYHLAGIATGAQTVSVTRTGTDPMFCTSSSYTTTGGGLTEVRDSNIAQGDVANPSITLNFGADNAFGISAIFSGLAAPASLTPGSASGVHNLDFGNQAGITARWGQFTGSQALTYTAASDDVAYAALAIGEAAAAGATGIPYLVMAPPRAA